MDEKYKDIDPYGEEIWNEDEYPVVICDWWGYDAKGDLEYRPSGSGVSGVSGHSGTKGSRFVNNREIKNFDFHKINRSKYRL